MFDMQGYVARFAAAEVWALLRQFPAVALLGPRQCGKSTLARRLLAKIPDSVYLDLERPSHLRQLSDPELFFSSHTGQLVCLDEVQRQPDLFAPLRSILDESGEPGQLLVLGSASRKLLQQSSETLAGRIAYLELTPLRLAEINAGKKQPSTWRSLLLRGGYPSSYLADSDAASSIWRAQFVRTYLEHELPQLGVNAPAATMLRLWQMCAHNHGQILNASKLAESLGISAPSVRRHLDGLAQTFAIRLLPPFFTNLKKRLVKAPKLYLRDTGLLLSLLQVETFDQLLGHPVFGAAWESFVIEQVLAHMGDKWVASFYRTQTGVEVDLILERADKRIAIECKASTAPTVGRGFYQALKDLAPHRTFIVAPVSHPYPLTEQITVTGPDDLLPLLTQIREAS